MTANKAKYGGLLRWNAFRPSADIKHYIAFQVMENFRRFGIIVPPVVGTHEELMPTIP
jgi:hypothetical protein